MVGLVHAQAALAQAVLLPILHLGHVNPYVTGVLLDEQGRAALASEYAQSGSPAACFWDQSHFNCPCTAGAMEMASKQGGWAVARQPGSLPAASAPAAPAIIGVSAFAFQGTNAHAVMTAAAAGASTAKPSAHWARQRFWVAPRPHAGKFGCRTDTTTHAHCHAMLAPIGI